MNIWDYLGTNFQVGFRKIVFSTDNKMVIADLKYLENNHISHSQRITAHASR